MNKVAPRKGTKGVLFTYFSKESIESVSVAGTFNNWNPERNVMGKTDEGHWELELSIPKGRHLYKIVVDGDRWLLDPLNPNVSEDGQNNSALTVTEEGEVLIRTTEITKESPGYMYENYEALESPEWIKKAVIYELHIRAFADNGFRGLADKMNYFKELGVNVLWVMPFQDVGQEKRIGKYGDPYAVKDYYSIDSNFGTVEELKYLIGEAHKNGIRIIMDWVMNRGSVDHILTKSNPEYFTRNENHEVYYEVPNRDYFAGLNFDNEEMRNYIVKAMKYWIAEFDFDGFRLDDSDLTPYDFLSDIKRELGKVKNDVVLISQSYDEYHHLESCDLTYDGNPRILIKDMIEGRMSQKEFIEIYDSYKYSFPKNARRMSWLEEKEQSRIRDCFGDRLAMPAASILMTLEGTPFVMMGQEFNEGTYKNWTSLFDEYKLDWEAFDQEMYEHYKFLIRLRANHAAFWNGELEFIPNSERMVLSYKRRSGEEEYFILINLSGEDLFVGFNEGMMAREGLNQEKELIYRTGKDEGGSKEVRSGLFVNPYETLIYKLI